MRMIRRRGEIGIRKEGRESGYSGRRDEEGCGSEIRTKNTRAVAVQGEAGLGVRPQMKTRKPQHNEAKHARRRREKEGEGGIYMILNSSQRSRSGELNMNRIEEK
jgi:hypothetical protein